MKFLHLYLLSVCLVEIYGQRSRTTSTNQDASKDEPAPVRTRGRARFSSTEEFAKIPEQPTRTTSNRRASTRTRIHSNNPKAAADRRALPTEAPSRGYAVEEINNDSPIDSFRRQSKSRVLTESRFEIADASASRRPVKYEASTPTPPIVNAVPVEDLGFGSTARAILQSRGEQLPGKTTTPVVDEEYLLTNFGSTIRSFRGDSAPTKTTTTPVVDEEYLLTNFGSTIRSLAAASRGAQVAPSRSRPRNDIPVQKATPIRSEIPILDREDIPARRTSIRGEPLPSLRNSDITIEREPPARSRNSAKAKLAEARENARIDSERKLTTEEAVIEDFVRLAPEQEAPVAVQGLPEQSELITETQPFEVSSETVLLEEEDVRRTPAVEISTPSSTYNLPTKRVVANGRRSGTRGRNFQESEGTQTPRSRPTRPPRPTKTSEERDSGSPVSSRARISSRRRFDDAVVAESRHRGPSVFTAEQYQDVTARSRTGRRIDSRHESVPERISVDLTPSTTIRSRTSGRRATTASSTTTDRVSARDRNTRGRGRSRSEPTVATNRPGSRRSSYVEETRPTIRRRDSGSNARKPSIVENTVSSNRRSKDESVPVTRRPNNVEDVVLYGERSDNLVNARDIITRADINELKVNNRRTSSIQTAQPSRRRGGTSRFDIPDDIINERITSEQTRKEKPSSRFDVIQTRTRNPNRNVASSRQTEAIEETTIYYGEKSRRTDPPDTTTTTTTTTTTDKPILKSNTKSRSRFPESPPRIDESKLEVLPLFEREPKAVASTRSRGQRSRSVSRRNSEDHMRISATENDVRFVEKPTTSAFTRVTVTRTESIEASTSRARLSTRTASPTTTETPRRSSSSSSSSSSTLPTTTRVVTTTTTKPPVTTTRASETTTKKWVTRSPPVIKESVVAEINQVTSKSTITRRKKVPKAKAAEMLSRGNKKADVRLSDVGKKKNSDEEIDEEDNYPEPFKALIQAKKNKDEPRPQQSSTRSATSATISKSTTTERVIVTSVGVPRSSSTARVVTTTVAPRKSQELDDFINDTENELDPKPVTSFTTTTTNRPTRGRLLPKFSEKPKYQPRHKEKFSKSTEKPRFSPEKHATKTTSLPRKSYSTKSYSTRASSEHHLRRKALRSTAFPPSTTPLTIVNREAKFSAKFVKKENKVPETSTTDKSVKFIGNQSPKGLYSSRKGGSKESVDGEEKVARQLDVSLIQSAKPTQTIKKFGSSRYSSRYRSDTSTRSSVLKSTTSAPFYIPTIPTPAYLPTVPTITPPVTPERVIWSDHRPFDYTWYYVKK